MHCRIHDTTYIINTSYTIPCQQCCILYYLCNITFALSHIQSRIYSVHHAHRTTYEAPNTQLRIHTTIYNSTYTCNITKTVKFMYKYKYAIPHTQYHVFSTICTNLHLLYYIYYTMHTYMLYCKYKPLIYICIYTHGIPIHDTIYFL
jgi:hypothetical protein